MSDPYLYKCDHKLVTIDEQPEELFSDDDKSKLKNKIIEDIQGNKFPKELYISTITVTCKIKNINFNRENIARYVDLSYDGIERIIYTIQERRKKNEEIDKKLIIDRSLPNSKIKRKNKKNKKVKKEFYNQISISLNIMSKNKNFVHVKIFTNGSLQMTGCQTAEDIYQTILSIITILKKDKYIVDNQTNKIKHVPFVDDKTELKLGNINDLEIKMINSNFKVQFHINLAKLYDLMLNKDIECIHDKMNHSCVNIKYYYFDHKISIFVFEKGAIVITGAQNGEQINSAYMFINRFVYSNYKLIVKINKSYDKVKSK